MLVIISNKRDEHVDKVIPTLNEQDIPFIRINTDDYPQRITGSVLFDNGFTEAKMDVPLRHIDFDKVSVVWNRRPRSPVPHDDITDQDFRLYVVDQSQSFLRNLWHMLSDKFWVNHPHANRNADQKMLQLKLAQKLGFVIPPTLVSNDPTSVKSFYESHGQKIILKPLYLNRMNHKRGIAIGTHLITPDHAANLDDVAFSPSIFQAYIEKQHELRVTIIGDQVFTAALYSQNTDGGQIDWRRVAPEDMEHQAVALPGTIEEKCFVMLQEFGLQFGTFDFIVTPQGEYVFLELNPNGQWVWIEELTGMQMIDAMVRLLIR